MKTNNSDYFFMTEYRTSDNYKLSLITLQFNDNEQEAKYRRSILTLIGPQIRFALTMSVLLTIIYAFFDRFMYPQIDDLFKARVVRFGVMLPVQTLFIPFTFTDFYRRHTQITAFSAVSIVAGSLCYLNLYSDANVIVYIFPAIIMALLYCFFFVGLFFVQALALSILVFFSFLGTLVTADMSFPMTISVCASMISIFLLICMAAYQKEVFSRELYASEMTQHSVALRQSLTDGRHIQWLRQLGTFLRHEVRQPVAQINSSIEIARMISGSTEPLINHLDSAGQGVQDVWNLIERASQATDAEAFVRRADPIWLDLTALASDIVEEYRKTNYGVLITHHSDTEFSLYADETLVKEVMRNLLNNAISYAHDNTVIETSIRSNDTSIEIRVVNKGPLISGNSEELFKPFSSTRIGPTSEHQGIGLYLVRLIAEALGGTAALNNLPDGSGVVAVVSFAKLPSTFISDPTIASRSL